MVFLEDARTYRITSLKQGERKRYKHLCRKQWQVKLQLNTLDLHTPKSFIWRLFWSLELKKIILCDFISFMHWNALAFSKQPVNFHNDFLKNYASKNRWTLNLPCISGSCIEMKIKLNFLFSYFFVVPQKVLWIPLRPS